MALETIIDNIKTVLEGVSGIGIVHNYERWTISEQKYLEFFKTAGNKINGWMITRRGCREEIETGAPQNHRWHRIVISGYYGLKDSAASEVTFRTLVEGIMAALRENDSLNGAALQSGAPQLVVSRMAPFSAILCHKAEIELEVEEVVSYTYS